MTVVAASGIACVAAFLRRPDAILNPRFFAEDGTIWYAEALGSGTEETLARHPESGATA